MTHLKGLTVKYFLHCKDAGVIPEGVTSDSLLKVDDNLMATAPIPSDANVLLEYLLNTR